METLREIRTNLSAMPEREFHEKMIVAFSYAVDTHTLYGVPPRSRGPVGFCAVAFLPFQIRTYKDAEGMQFGVTRLMPTEADGSFGHEWFRPGVTITHWTGNSASSHINNSQGRVPAGNSIPGWPGARIAPQSSL